MKNISRVDNGLPERHIEVKWHLFAVETLGEKVGNHAHCHSQVHFNGWCHSELTVVAVNHHVNSEPTFVVAADDVGKHQFERLFKAVYCRR